MDLNLYYASHKPYCTEAAKSNRAQCRETSCKVNIGKGDLRIGCDRGDRFHWYHAQCAFKTHDNRYLANPKITSTDQLYGFEDLSADHKTLLGSLIDGTYVEPPALSYGPRPKRRCVKGNEEFKDEEREEQNTAATNTDQQSHKRRKQTDNKK